MKRVYIAGPISRGNLADNVNAATNAFVLLAKAGLSPFCPQWSVYSKPAAMLNVEEEDFDDPDRCVCVGTKDGNGMTLAEWLAVDLPWVAVSDVVLRLPGRSEGADAETAHATLLGIPVFGSVGELIAWSRQ